MGACEICVLKKITMSASLLDAEQEHELKVVAPPEKDFLCYRKQAIGLPLLNSEYKSNFAELLKEGGGIIYQHA